MRCNQQMALECWGHRTFRSMRIQFESGNAFMVLTHTQSENPGASESRYVVNPVVLGDRPNDILEVCVGYVHIDIHKLPSSLIVV